MTLCNARCWKCPSQARAREAQFYLFSVFCSIYVCYVVVVVSISRDSHILLVFLLWFFVGDTCRSGGC